MSNNESGNSNSDESSVTLPGCINGTETSSSSDELCSENRSTQDELIGTPGSGHLSEPDSTEAESLSDNNENDRGTVVFVKENEIVAAVNANESNENDKNGIAALTGSEIVGSDLGIMSETESELMFTNYRVELRRMKRMVDKLQAYLDTEKDSVVHLRKKLSQTNKDKLDQTTKFNEQMSTLRCENVTLQARLEEQGVYTEQLEYELTKTRKCQQKEKIVAEKRENQDESTITDLKSRLNDASSKLATLEEEFSCSKNQANEELHSLRTKLAATESSLSSTQADIESSRAENTRLAHFIKEQESTMKEMLEKMQSTENELSVTSQQLSSTKEKLANQESQTAQELQRLQEIKSQFNTLQAQLKEEQEVSSSNQQLIESLEAKSTQLECQLNDEKKKSGELRDLAQNLRQRLQDSDNRLSGQTLELDETYNKLTRCEQEMAMLNKHLESERDDKRDLVSKLKKQLDLHQEHMNKLKSELTTAHKQQRYMDEITRKIVTDLQFVFKEVPHGDDEYTTSDWSKNVIENLHITTSRFRKKLEDLSIERDKAQALCDSLTKESSSYREMLYKKDQELEQTNEKIAELSKDGERLAHGSAELEAKCATLTVDLETAKSHNQTLTAQCQTLNKELQQMRSRAESETVEKVSYLKRLFEMLTAVEISAAGENQSERSERFNDTWLEASTLVTEQISHILNQICQMKSKITRLEDALKRSEGLIDDMKVEHNDQMTGLNENLATAIEQNNMEWREEKTRLEDHYSSLMLEQQNREQKSQWNADEAWERLKQSDDLNRILENEKSQLLSRASNLEKQQLSLLCGLALISGSYFPLLHRNWQLEEQKSLLLHQLNRFHSFKMQVYSLLSTLDEEKSKAKGHTSPKTPVQSELSRKACRAHLNFKKAVLAVIACNRLKKVSHHGQLVITIQDGSRSSNLLCWSTAEHFGSPAPDSLSDSHIVGWLCHADLESIALTSTVDTVNILEKIRGGESNADDLPSAISSSLSKMIRQLSVLYNKSQSVIPSSPLKYYRFTSRQSAYSSHRYMNAKSHNFIAPTSSGCVIATRLQEKTLELVQQLHCREKERKSMKNKLESLSQAAEQLKHCKQTCLDLEKEISLLRNQADEMVSRDRMQSVMMELNQTLEREKEAQVLLTNQSLQIKDLNRRLAEQKNERENSEYSVRMSIQSLNDELNEKSRMASNLSQQISNLEAERQSTHTKLYELEKTVRISDDDRKSLNNYLETLSRILQQNNANGRSDISMILLSRELIPSGQVPSVLLKVHRLVTDFVDIHSALQAKISALNNVTGEQIEDISRLKQELSLVCTGQSKSAFRHVNSQTYEYPKTMYMSLPTPNTTRELSQRDTIPYQPSQPHTPVSYASNRYQSQPGARNARGTETLSPRLEMEGNRRR